MTQDELGSPARRVSVGGRTINVRIVRRESAGVTGPVPGARERERQLDDFSARVRDADRHNRAVVEATGVFDSVDERIASTDLQYRNGGYESRVLTQAAQAAGRQYVRERCRCGRVRARNASQCTRCYKAEREARDAKELAEIGEVNRALGAGLVWSYEATSIPGQDGQTYRSLYVGVPGVWSISSTGRHWCEGSVRPALLEAARAFNARGAEDQEQMRKELDAWRRIGQPRDW